MNKKKIKMKRQIKIIKKFAKKMGYEIEMFQLGCYCKRPTLGIELCGTSDSNNEPFRWAWYLDTYDEVL